jgi:hypothetical protein
MIPCATGAAMKLAVGIFIIIWLLCGLAGAWMMGETGIHWKTIAKGPITLVKAFKEDPVSYPGP